MSVKNQMRVADYIMVRLQKLGIKQVYFLPGGGAMHLNDALACNSNLEPILCLHEQACSIAAEAACKILSAPSACLVTCGPGSTNVITGTLGAWLDSMPVFFISGQVKTADIKTGTGLRMLGVQEVDIVSIVTSITKKAVTVTNPNDIAYIFDELEHAALSGRKGPVWLDVPLDVQAALINPDELKRYTPNLSTTSTNYDSTITKICDLLKTVQRPVLLVGNGIRISGAYDEFKIIIGMLNVPILTTWLGMDLIEDEHPLFAGRPGSIAPRCANFTLQNSDLIIIIGARLDMALTAYAHDKFARGAKKIMIDIDEAEIKKMRFHIDLPIIADAKVFLSSFIQILIQDNHNFEFNNWLNQINSWKLKYPLLLAEHIQKSDGLSLYYFTDVLSERLANDDIIATGSAGLAVELFLLSLKIKKNQRCFHNRGTGSMGFGLPAAIGACLSVGRMRTICVEGDGGLQMNVQELASLSALDLPVKLFVINNNGYASIRTSQINYFKRLVGADASSGMRLPELSQLAKAYGISYSCISDADNLSVKIDQVLNAIGPVLCEVVTKPEEARIPRVASKITAEGKMESSPLEDLYPFLNRDEFKQNMYIPTLD